MRRIRNAVGRRYIADVRSLLPWVDKGRRRLLSDLRSDVECFLQENPQADRAALDARFGTPQQIVTGYLEMMDLDQFRRAMRLRKVILWTAGILVAFILITWLSVVVGEIIYVNTLHNGYGRIELT